MAVLAAVLFGEKLGPTAVVGLLTGVVGLLFVNVPPDTWEVLFEGELFPRSLSAMRTHNGWAGMKGSDVERGVPM